MRATQEILLAQSRLDQLKRLNLVIEETEQRLQTQGSISMLKPAPPLKGEDDLIVIDRETLGMFYGARLGVVRELEAIQNREYAERLIANFRRSKK